MDVRRYGYVGDQIRRGFHESSWVIDYKSKTYLFYHNGALPGGGGFDRSVCVDELNFDANGGVSWGTPTPGLSQGVGTLNPFDHIQAETIAWEQGVHTAYNKDSGIFVTSIDPGDYIKVRQVNFKRMAKLFFAHIKPLTGETIEIRLNTREGKLLGVCDVKKAGTEDWGTVTCKVDSVRGIHDI